MSHKDPEARRAYMKRYRKTAKYQSYVKRYRRSDSNKAVQNKHKYGEAIVPQFGTCPICGAVTKMVIDHDHRTGRIRGLICAHCNKGLGFFRDDPKSLRRAADYLQESDSQEPDPRV